MGRYQPGAGKTGCTNITVGYKGVGGNASLVNPGHLAEVQCSAGKYFSNFTCLPCPVDTYTSMPGATSCKECDDGTLTKGVNGSTTCDVCDAGEEMRGELGSRACHKCDGGKISVAGGNLSVIHI